MNNCKKYACHRVYEAGKIYHSQSVVSLDEAGRVVGCSPLMEETAATEWIGGIIILSPLAEMVPTSDFQSLLKQLTLSASGENRYAWHIDSFDFAKESLTAQSVVRKL